MSSPTLVRTAVVVSMVTTGGAIYYRLSDGGDPKVAQKKVEENIIALEGEVAKMGKAGAAFVDKLKALTSNAKEDIQELLDTHKSKDSSVDAIDDKDSPVYHEREPQMSTHPFCHTCSGPRIWFFAEKLRLKRRFTPYPDPPRE